MLLWEIPGKVEEFDEDWRVVVLVSVISVHWRLVRQCVDFKICLLVCACLHQLAAALPRVNDHSCFGSFYTSPFAQVKVA